ncbi:uncharacterized protein BDV17DRAFT_227198 [Aspergillus undulatus]|uniref:uncharacterized protein n=1 Tax=Aspergillus undulatus TaxID=1810928 RepID=UPI003CCD4CAF
MASRTDRLAKFFDLVLSGNRPISNVDSFSRFLEAILDKSDHAACVERLLASPAARSAIYAGVRFDTKPNFLDNHTTPFLQYLADPSVKKLCNGQILQDILTLVSEPRTVLNAFMQTFQDGRLTEPGMQTFAWLLIELLTHPSINQSDVINDAQVVVDNGSLLRAESPDTCSHGHKLVQMLQLEYEDL